MHTEQEVAADRLARALLQAAFLVNEEHGAIRFETGNLSRWFGLRTRQALFVKSAKETPSWPRYTLEWAIPGLARGTFTEPTIAVDSDPDRAERAATAHDLSAALSPEEFHDGVATEEYDAVYICTPNAFHLPYVRTAAEFGKAVLREKPMEADADRAAEMVDVCAQAVVTLMVGYGMQTEPAVRRTRELIREGFLGDVVQVHGHMSQVMLEDVDAAEDWRLDYDLSGGCAVMDIGIYPLNTTRFVLGDTPELVAATTRSDKEPFEEVDEHVSLRATFPKGVTALWTATQSAYHDSFLRIVGTEGRVTLDPAFFEREARGLTVERAGGGADLAFEQVHQLEEEFDYFAHCLLTDERPHPDGNHGLVDMNVIEAVYESVERGAPVEPDL